jgi:hypothetical protein
VGVLSTGKGNYIVSIDCTKYSMLDYHTDESLLQSADLLEAERAHLGKIAFDKLEKALGINHNAHGMLFDKELQEMRLVLPLRHWLWDWMHVLLCGGGASIELECFLASLTDIGVTMEQLDGFIRNYKLPRGMSKLCKHFMQERFKKKCLKLFASESLVVLMLLLDFAHVIVAPLDLLQNEIYSFSLLYKILHILKMGSGAVLYIGRLKVYIEKHQSAFIKCYDNLDALDNVKPKAHYLFHLPEVVQRVGRSLNCFAVERKHSQVKARAEFIFRNFEFTLAVDYVNSQFDDIAKNVNIFEASYIHNDWLTEAAWAKTTLAQYIPNLASVSTAIGVHLECGTVYRRDLVLCNLAGDRKVVAQVLGLYQVSLHSGRVGRIADIDVFAADPDNAQVWSRAGQPSEVCAAEDIIATLIYAAMDSNATKPEHSVQVRVLPPLGVPWLMELD